MSPPTVILERVADPERRHHVGLSGPVGGWPHGWKALGPAPESE